MKRLILLIAALPLSFSALCQEASVGDGASLSVISRIEANPYLPNSGQGGVDLSNSSLYTLLEGNIGEMFSYSVCNHWLSAYPADLYQSTFHSDSPDWCDWANISLNTGNFSFTVGKMSTSVGGFELYEYDYDSHFNFNSLLWNSMMIYQWGLGTAWTSGSESTVLTAQMCSSPFSVHPFDDGKKMLNFNWTGEYGPLELIWSWTDFTCSGGEDDLKAFVAGNRLNFGIPLYFNLDYAYRYGTFAKGHDIIASIGYNADKFDIILKGGYETAGSEEDILGIPCKYVFGGAALHYYPLRDSQDLRLHAVVTRNNLEDCVSLNLGATYFLNLNFKKH